MELHELFECEGEMEIGQEKEKTECTKRGRIKQHEPKGIQAFRNERKYNNLKLSMESCQDNPEPVTICHLVKTVFLNLILASFCPSFLFLTIDPRFHSCFVSLCAYQFGYSIFFVLTWSMGSNHTFSVLKICMLILLTFYQTIRNHQFVLESQTFPNTL